MADKNAGQLAREKQAKANKAAGVKRKAADESRQKEGQRNRDLAKKRQPYKNFGTTKKTLEERYTPEEIAKMNMKKAPKPVQGAGNMPLSDAEAAKQVEILKAQNKDKKVKKMNRGGMTQQERGRRGNPPPQRKPNPKMLQVDTPRMEDAPPGMARGGMTKRMMGASNAPESGPTKPMVSPKPKPKGPAPYDDSDPKPRKMKSGGKVRGYGMARGGKACKMR
jgi:hypothetical protein